MGVAGGIKEAGALVDSGSLHAGPPKEKLGLLCVCVCVSLFAFTHIYTNTLAITRLTHIHFLAILITDSLRRLRFYSLSGVG